MPSPTAITGGRRAVLLHMSIFDQLLTDMAEAFEDVLAQRDAAGEFEAVTYIPQHGIERTIAVANQGQRTHTLEADPETGYLERRERIRLVCRTSVLVAAGITAPHIAGRVRLADGTEWAIDAGDTQWGQVLTTLGLARKALIRQAEGRRADV